MGDFVFSQYCTRRKYRKQNPTPPIRLELATSPYVNNTENDIYMRRKAEILKFAGSQKNNYIGKPTKAERFSQVVRGVGRNRRSQEIDSACKNVRTLATQSDVPGKNIELYLDESVPLYNYATRQNAFAVQIENYETPWKFYIANTVDALYINVPTIIGAIEFLENISNPKFIWTIPFGTTLDITDSIMVTFKLELLYNNATIKTYTKEDINVIEKNDNEVIFDNIEDIIATNSYLYEFRMTIASTIDNPIILNYDKMKFSLVTSI